MQKMTMRTKCHLYSEKTSGRTPLLSPTPWAHALILGSSRCSLPCFTFFFKLPLPALSFGIYPQNHRVQHKTLRVRPSLPPFGAGGRVGSSHCAPGASSFSIKVPAPPRCMTLASNPALLSLGFFFICKTETILG